MKNVSVEGQLREKTGTRDAKRLRREGMVPCVLYGEQEPTHFSIEQKHAHKFVFSPDVHRIQAKLGDRDVDTIIQDIQYDPVTDEVIHLDMLKLDPNKKVKVMVPVVTHGVPIGVKEGGRLRLAFKKIGVVALPDNVPDAIEVDIEEMQVGDYIRIADLPYPNLEFAREPETVVVAVKALRSMEDLVLTPTAELEGEEGEEAEGEAEGAAAEEGEGGGEEEGDKE